MPARETRLVSVTRVRYHPTSSIPWKAGSHCRRRVRDGRSASGGDGVGWTYNAVTGALLANIAGANLNIALFGGCGLLWFFVDLTRQHRSFVSPRLSAESQGTG